LSAQLAKAKGALSNAEAKLSEIDREYQAAEALAAKDKDTHKGGGCGFLGYKCVAKAVHMRKSCPGGQGEANRDAEHHPDRRPGSVPGLHRIPEGPRGG
jgi:hypothetical protein